jgi:hypothetical protein
LDLGRAQAQFLKTAAMQPARAIIGISDHCGWAVFVTALPDGTLLDRRRIQLVADDLPKLPHHVEAQSLPLDQAIELIDRVRSSAEKHAEHALAAVASTIAAPIAGVALRASPPLPATIAERITDYRAKNVADTVMYRNALARAAQARGWTVHTYQTKHVFESARQALNIADLDAHVRDLRQSLGPPWTQDHKLALAAAIVAGSGSPTR